MPSVNKLCAISMALSIVTIVLAGTLGHFAPAPTHTDSAQKVAVFYQMYSSRILVFAFFGCISTTFMIPAFCALSVAMMKLQRPSATLSLLQLTSGTVATIGPFLSSMTVAAAAVRPDNPPFVLATLTDLTVLFIELSTLPALFQGACLAAAIFADRSPRPVLPRWYGWTSIIWGVLAQGGLFGIFNKTGALSSTGFIGIVVPIVSLLVWMVATTFVVYRLEDSAD